MIFGKSPFIHENPNMMYGKILEGEVSFPKENRCSEELQDFIKKLLKKNGAERLGYDDEQEIFAHAWFNDITFSKMIEKKIPARIIPHIDHEELNNLIKKSSHQAAEQAKEGEQEKEKEQGQTEGKKDKTSDKTNETKDKVPRGPPTVSLLDLSFEREEEKKPKKDRVGSETNEDFSYFEEEEYVETAMHEEEFDELEELYRETIFETGMSEHSSEDEEHKRDALDSPKDESHHRQVNVTLLRKNSLGAKEIVAERRKMSENQLKNNIKAAEAEDKLKNVSLKMGSNEIITELKGE